VREHFKNTTSSKRGMPKRPRHTIKNCEPLCLPMMLFTIRYHHDHLLDMSNASSIVQDREAGLGFAESPIIADIIETALFEDRCGYGVKFSSYFKPIPFNLLALVITIVCTSCSPSRTLAIADSFRD
jgi:hypothetical protein